MDVILHIGAHRTGTTSLQRALQQNRQRLGRAGIAIWGPGATRDGRFEGMFRFEASTDVATSELIRRRGAAVRAELDRLTQAGRKFLIVSEENMLGGMNVNLVRASLYPEIELRLARFAAVFGGTCTRIGLAIRPYEEYWASVCAFRMFREHGAPDPAEIERLAHQPRTWRRVINGVSAMFPKAEIVVWDAKTLIGRPTAQLRALTGANGPQLAPTEVFNASPTQAELREALLARGDDASAKRIPATPGRYAPFSADQLAVMQQRYAADLDWLAAGPDGVTFVCDGADNLRKSGAEGKEE